MTNKEAFDVANKNGDDKLKSKLRTDFLDWCIKYGRTPLNPISLTDWWKENLN